MSRSLHEVLTKKTLPISPAKPVMVYMCECGTKWADSARPTWDCKCGRRLIKRNGVIYAAIGQTAGQASGPRLLRIAAG